MVRGEPPEKTIDRQAQDVVDAQTVSATVEENRQTMFGRRRTLRGWLCM
jgi:hypothetical protein